MKKTRAAFFKLAAAHSVEVEYSSSYRDPHNGTRYPFHIMLDAPQGTVFRRTELHCDGSIQGDEGSPTTDWARAYDELQTIVAEGFEPCTVPDCEYCNPTDEA